MTTPFETGIIVTSNQRGFQAGLGMRSRKCKTGLEEKRKITKRGKEASKHGRDLLLALQ